MDIGFASAVEISALVRSGQASPREVTEAALRRIEALDPALNAFVAVDGERALAAADAVQPGDAQPFAGDGHPGHLHPDGMHQPDE